MSGQEPPQWEEGREAGKSLDGQKQQTRMFTLPLLDLGLKPRGSDPKEQPKGHDEEHMMSEALQFLKQKEYERARSVAEMVLRANPANQTAVAVGAKEREINRDWKEAASWYLEGMRRNPADTRVDIGYQTNLSLLRFERQRMKVERSRQEDNQFFHFKPMAEAIHDQSSEDERLGRRYEEIYCDEGHIQDLMATQVQQENERAELRRTLLFHRTILDRIFAYYKQGKFEQEFSDKDEIDVLHHTGEEDYNDMMPIVHLWRMLKSCRLIHGEAKPKLSIAACNRIISPCRQRSRKAEQQELDEDISDVHDYHANLNFYEWIEALIRISFIKVHKGSLSSRFETMVEENIARFAMKRLKDSSYLQFADVTVQNTLNETNMELALRKIFDYFIAISKSTNAKKPQDNKDVTMNVNHLIAMSSKMELYDPRYTIKKLVELFSLVTLDVDALPQEHPNNQTTEMIFFEFLEFLFRISKLKGESSEAGPLGMRQFLLKEIIPMASKIIPGNNKMFKDVL